MMKLSKNTKLIAMLAACASAFGIFAYRGSTQEQTTHQDQKQELVQILKRAEDLQQSHPLQALTLLNENKEKFTSYPRLYLKWKKLALTSARSIGNTAWLFALWQEEPTLFEDKEILSMKLAEYALSQKDLTSFNQIFKEWETKKTSSEWVLLEADAYALTGNSDQALQLLSSSSFKGNQEIKRLLRLALLSDKDHPKVAWDYLLQALIIDPNSPEIRFYRAKLLENAKRPDLAALEYKEASLKGDDPFFTEELANFYFNQGKYQELADLLQLTEIDQGSDSLALSAIFLSKVYKPNQKLHDALALRPLNPLLRYLLSLSSNEFWNDKKSENEGIVATDMPEILWLQVFEKLKLGSDRAAFETLVSHPEMSQLNPSLYEGLKKGIAIHHPDLKKETGTYHLPQEGMHPLFSILAEQELPKQYQNLMESNQSYAALTLASGWVEAALDLQKWYPESHPTFSQLSSQFPQWVVRNFAQGLAANRSASVALDFIHKQKLTPKLALLSAELNLNEGNYSEAENMLLPLAKTSSQAALLLASLYHEQNQFIPARTAILNNPTLASSSSGKAMLARLELSYGDHHLAEKMYQEIADISTEAKSYFAKKAYQMGDYKTAYTLTRELADQFPDRQDLKSQLRKIRETAASKK